MSNMKLYSQNDPLWSQDRIGQSSLTVGRYGCTLTCICMINSKFYEEHVVPKEAARTFTFTKDGLIIWSESDFRGMKFVARGYYDNKERIKEYSDDPNKGVILEVNHNHWVAVDKVGEDIHIYDPWDGTETTLAAKNYAITGYALFEKAEAVKPKHWSDDAMQWMLDNDLLMERREHDEKVQWGEFVVVVQRLYEKLQ